MDQRARSGSGSPAHDRHLEAATAPAGDGGVLLVQWGRSNAGPLMLREYADALVQDLGDRLHVSGNRSVEPSVRITARVGRYDVDTYRSAAGALLGVPRLLRQAIGLRRYIKRNRIAVVFAPMFSLWQTLALPLWLPRGTRYVSTVHDAIDHPGERHLVRDACRWIEVSRADAIVTYSTEVETAVRARIRGRRPVVRLELGAPTTGRRREVLPSRPVIGFFGRLVAYKGLDAFVDAVRQVATARPVHGEVRGQGDVDDRLIRSSAGVVDWRIGYVGEHEVAEVLRGFDLLVLPYQEASQSGVVLQAFAEGLPVVATPVGGLRGQVEGRGGVVSAGTGPAAVAEAIERVLEPDRYRELSDLAVSTAAARSWRAVSAPLLLLLDGLTR